VAKMIQDHDNIRNRLKAFDKKTILQEGSGMGSKSYSHKDIKKNDNITVINNVKQLNTVQLANAQRRSNGLIHINSFWSERMNQKIMNSSRLAEIQDLIKIMIRLK
jgi:hypothetical protein